jgi:hypothetical protein
MINKFFLTGMVFVNYWQTQKENGKKLKRAIKSIKSLPERTQ